MKDTKLHRAGPHSALSRRWSSLRVKAQGLFLPAVLGILCLVCAQPGQASYMPFNTSVNMNVGIGTSTPQAAFAVANGNVGIGTWTAAGGNLIVNGGGNVGIGSAWPGQTLDVNGVIRSSLAGNSTFNGNVGIGSTTPGQSLDVQGFARMTGFTLTGNGASNGFVLVGNGVGVGTWMPSTTLNVTATGTPGGSVPQLQFNSAGALGGVLGSGADANGNIGIGTSGPLERLAVVGNVGIGTQSYSTFITTAPAASGLVVEGNVGIGTTKNAAAGLSVMNGNVGIGTWTPTSALEVEGGNVGIGTSANSGFPLYVYANAPGASTGLYINNPNTTNAVAQLTLVAGGQKWQINNQGDQSNQLNFVYNGSSAAQISAAGNFTTGGTGISAGGSGISSASNLSVGSNFAGLAAPVNGAIIQGNVGIGTVQPGSMLTVVGNVGIGTVKDGDNYVTNAAPNGGLAVEGNVGIGTWAPNAALIVRSGNVGIGTASANYSLQIGGCTTITGTTSCVDLAELIPSSERVASGDIVMLDPSRSVTVMKATRADNDLLFGVVTTDPAIVIEGPTVGILNGKKYRLDPRKPAVALAGRVPVKVDLENGPVRIGDMIATSSQPGIGARALGPGRVIGMALEPMVDLKGAPYQTIYAYINPHWWESTPLIDEEIARLKAQNSEFEVRLKELEKKVTKRGQTRL